MSFKENLVKEYVFGIKSECWENFRSHQTHHK